MLYLFVGCSFAPGQRLNRDFSCGFWKGEMYVASGNMMLIPK